MMSVNHLMRSCTAAALCIGLAASAAGCSSSSQAQKSESGPVTIEVWGWDKNAHRVVDDFNRSQKKVKVRYVLQASNTATQQNFRNAFTAKSGVPDYVQGFAPLTTNVANGWAADITDSIQPLLKDYTKAARSNAMLNGKYYGIPGVASGQFALINTDVLSRYHVQAPKTWDEALALGRRAQKDGIKLFNLAGEDPSTLLALSQEAGAKWFTIDGDRWDVNFHDAGTKAAATIIQQMIDGDMVSNQTYQDKPALYRFFDSGKLAMITTQYWSIGGYQSNMPKSAGKWEPFAFPAISDTQKGAPGIMNQSAFIPAGTSRSHQDAVMMYMHYLNTKRAFEAGRDPETHTTGLPQGLTPQTIDIDKYVHENIPHGFYSNDQQAFTIVKQATDNVLGSFDLGPDYDAWFPEMQDQWGKVVAHQQTLDQALDKVQTFVAHDLKSKGINYQVAK